MRSYTPFRPLLAAAALTLAATSAQAQRVASRADLNAFLGATAVTESFEDVPAFPSWVVGFGAGIPRLDATTNRPGLPAGTIVPGLAFTNGNGIHYFHQPTAGTAHLGYTSKTYAPGRNIWDMLLETGARAVGFDLFANTGLSFTAGTITFFGANDAALGTIATTLRPGESTFFGWQNGAGEIRRVHFEGFYPSGASSADIDDITFGVGATTTTPEPGTWALLATGLAGVVGVARRRRRA